ncbi:hypothetical protein [Mycolicibacterium mengxianglii]|uniref:hypothetical protein n=1 Tax=Mycolicibacterium mengxianglii TaxID=2736649 RepID=UPI0018D07499|nr:hypothetical protein [Mycolicibacterium mengxianglii]
MGLLHDRPGADDLVVPSLRVADRLKETKLIFVVAIEGGAGCAKASTTSQSANN